MPDSRELGDNVIEQFPEYDWNRLSMRLEGLRERSGGAGSNHMMAHALNMPYFQTLEAIDMGNGEEALGLFAAQIVYGAQHWGEGEKAESAITDFWEHVSRVFGRKDRQLLADHLRAYGYEIPDERLERY